MERQLQQTEEKNALLKKQIKTHLLSSQKQGTPPMSPNTHSKSTRPDLLSQSFCGFEPTSLKDSFQMGGIIATRINFDGPSMTCDESFLKIIGEVRRSLQILYKSFIVTIPYKPKSLEVKQLTQKLLNFERQINDCIQKVQELLDMYEERQYFSKKSRRSNLRV